VRGLTLTVKMCAGQVGSRLPHAVVPHAVVPHAACRRAGDHDRSSGADSARGWLAGFAVMAAGVALGPLAL